MLGRERCLASRRVRLLLIQDPKIQKNVFAKSNYVLLKGICFC